MFRVQVTGYRLQGSGCRVQVAGFRLQGSGCRVSAEGGPAFGGKPETCSLKLDP